MSIRMPAVSGAFYPAERSVLTEQIKSFMAHACTQAETAKPGMLIVPHAGYVYSGQIAADAYQLLTPYADAYDKVVVLGPSHRVPLHGIALSPDQFFATPFGHIALDTQVEKQLLSFDFVELRADAHFLEHSLEVQLPFLQWALNDFRLIPLVVGDAKPEQISAVLDLLWDEQTLIVVSTDLSHFLYDADAKRIDSQTIRKIQHLDNAIVGTEACGHYPLNGALHFAKARGWSATKLSQCNSGDVSGQKDRVVGYASFSLVDEQAA